MECQASGGIEMNDEQLIQMRTALHELYRYACHHPSCDRGETPHTCSCGVSAALELARVVLQLPDYEIVHRWLHQDLEK